MIIRSILLLAACLYSVPVFAASLVLSPSSQTAFTECTIALDARQLVDIKGIDIEISFDENILRCASMQFVSNALPFFSEFHRRIDNENGVLEVVLLKQTAGGYTGGAAAFLVLSFEAVSPGTAQVAMKKTFLDGDPLLIDGSGGGVEARVDTATVLVEGAPPISAAKLHQNYPNPFNPVTTIRFDVSAPSPVYLKVYDVKGRLVRALIDGTEYEIGSWERKWDGKSDGGSLVQSGVYLCVFEACGQRMSSKLVILR